MKCRKCGKPTELLSGYCEKCHIESRGILRAQHRERPKCREAILKFLKEQPDLTLFKLAFWTEYDKVPIIPSDGIRLQARKMLQEVQST